MRLSRPTQSWIEPLLAVIVAGGLIRVLLHLWWNGYLPQPFFYEPYDVWMDWFNTADWARDAGVYDSWGSIYPPLSFVFLKLVGLPQCYLGGSGAGTSYYARDCDWLGVIMLHGFYVLNIVLIARVYLKLDRRTALPRAVALSAGLPMANALERGNLIIVAFTCILLAYGPLLRSARLRWIAAGLAINFKPYLIAALFPQLLRRRWRWFEGAAIATVVIYLVTYCILGKGTPREIINNITSFSDSQFGALLDLWFAATYTPLLSLLRGDGLSVDTLIGSDAVNVALFVIPLMLRTVQLTVVVAAAAAWLRPEVVPMHRLTNLGLSLALITVEAAGYSQVLPVFFVFMERWRGFGLKWAIIACYVICFPFDYILDQAPPLVRDTYLTNSSQLVTYYIMLGPFLRPMLNMSIPFALACVTIGAVWSDIRSQGWRTRWRFRHDTAIMAGEGSAFPAGATAAAIAQSR